MQYDQHRQVAMLLIGGRLLNMGHCSMIIVEKWVGTDKVCQEQLQNYVQNSRCSSLARTRYRSLLCSESFDSAVCVENFAHDDGLYKGARTRVIMTSCDRLKYMFSLIISSILRHCTAYWSALERWSLLPSMPSSPWVWRMFLPDSVVFDLVFRIEGRHLSDIMPSDWLNWFWHDDRMLYLFHANTRYISTRRFPTFSVSSTSFERGPLRF